MLTEADILNDLISPEEPTLPVEAARVLLQLRFNDSASSRIQELLEAQNRGDLSEAARGELDKYLRVGQLLDLLQAKARLSLRTQTLA